MVIEKYWNKDFLKWFKENTPKEGLSENTSFSKQFVYDAYLQGREGSSNKWHYPDKGEYPKDEFADEHTKPRLPSAYKRFCCLCLGFDDYVMGKYIKGSFWTVEGKYSPNEILAWKEITIP